MKSEEAIRHLQKNLKPFKETKVFSDQPGIYAFSFIGRKFPLEGLQHLTAEDIIYIGKTESSQSSRNERTHFSSGKTGSSTLRRTLGALLKEELQLTAISRNDSDEIKGRTSMYKFDEPSEERLTKWMKDNLALSFLEYSKSKAEIISLETAIINKLKPPLNLSKNPGNPYAGEIQAKRKACAQEAFKKEFSGQKVKSTKVPQVIANQKQASKYVGGKSNPENKLKLHEAMEVILKEFPDRTTTAEILSEQIWKRQLYKKNDGGQAMPGQLKLRAKNYSQFELLDGRTKIRLKDSGKKT